MSDILDLTVLNGVKIIETTDNGYGTIILTTDKGIFEITTFVEDGAILIQKQEETK
jgi:hypothetical protein